MGEIKTMGIHGGVIRKTRTIQGRSTGRRRNQVIAVLLVLLPLLVSIALALECPISVHPSADPRSPDISSDRIVWTDTGDIFLYNISEGTETRLTSDYIEQLAPLISGSFVAWQEIDPVLLTTGIILRDIQTGNSLTLATNAFTHAISGDQIVWIDFDNSDIEYYNTQSGEHNTIVTGPFDRTQPAISGDRVLWVNGTCEDVAGCTSAIFMKDIKTGDEIRLVANTSDRAFPVISGNRVAWSDYRDGNWDIYLLDSIQNLKKLDETRISSDPYDQTIPALDGTRLVWVNYTDTGTEIYYDHLPDPHPPARISSGVTNDLPRISGNRVVWQRTEGGSIGISLYTIDAPAGSSCPVAGFTADITVGAAPLAVQFTDGSSGTPTHWSWDFGDGTTSVDPNPLHTYGTEGVFPVTLTVSNDFGRDSKAEPGFIHTGTPPTASFTTSTISGVKPLLVAFSDTSTGAPTGRAWDFENDGTVDTTARDPVHIYDQTGTYTVKFTATNDFGSDTATAPDLIWVMNGMNASATTTIDGLDIQDIGGVQHLTLDTTKMLGNTTGNTTWLSLKPRVSTGWQNITFISRSSTKFEEFPDGSIQGDIGSCIFESREIIPGMFLTDIGNNLPVSYRLELSAYPVGAEIYTTIWEGVTPVDERDFKRALGLTSPSFTSILDTAYTLVFVSRNIPPAKVQGATLNLSVSSDWVKKDGSQNNITVVRLGGDLVNQTLNPTATFTDASKNLDFFTVPSPRGLSRFALVSAVGSSNLIQMGARMATQVIQSSQGSGSRGSGSSDQPAVRDRTSWEQPPAAAQPPAEPAAATFYGEARIDTTVAGITREAVIISAEDHGAHILVPAGIEAFDAAQAPLAQVSVAPPAPGGIPSGNGAGSRGFTGIAYDVGPDGATFSPPATLTFTIPESSWTDETLYTIRTYDEGSGAWADIPTTADPATHTLTGQVSHLCLFGVFGTALPAAATPATPAAALTIPQPAPTGKPLPRTPMGTFTGIVGWVSATAMANPLAGALVLVVALLLSAAFIAGRRRSRITRIQRKK